MPEDEKKKAKLSKPESLTPQAVNTTVQESAKLKKGPHKGKDVSPTASEAHADNSSTQNTPPETSAPLPLKLHCLLEIREESGHLIMSVESKIQFAHKGMELTAQDRDAIEKAFKTADGIMLESFKEKLAGVNFDFVDGKLTLSGKDGAQLEKDQRRSILTQYKEFRNSRTTIAALDKSAREAIEDYNKKHQKNFSITLSYHKENRSVDELMKLLGDTGVISAPVKDQDENIYDEAAPPNNLSKASQTHPVDYDDLDNPASLTKDLNNISQNRISTPVSTQKALLTTANTAANTKSINSSENDRFNDLLKNSVQGITDAINALLKQMESALSEKQQKVNSQPNLSQYSKELENQIDALIEKTKSNEQKEKTEAHENLSEILVGIEKIPQYNSNKVSALTQQHELKRLEQKISATLDAHTNNHTPSPK